MNKAISLACHIRQECVKMGPEMVNLLGIGLGIDQPKKNVRVVPAKIQVILFLYIAKLWLVNFSFP